MRLRGIITILMLIASLSVFSHPLLAQTSEAKRGELREKIGLDLSVLDFETKKIDAKVMGSRLAGILNYLMENYPKSMYDRRFNNSGLTHSYN